MFIINNLNLGSPKGVLTGQDAKSFLASEKAVPSNVHWWGNDESAGVEACVFDGSVDVDKFNRGEPIDHYLAFINHAKKGSSLVNVGQVFLRVRLFNLFTNSYNSL